MATDSTAFQRARQHRIIDAYAALKVSILFNETPEHAKLSVSHLQILELLIRRHDDPAITIERSDELVTLFESIVGELER